MKTPPRDPVECAIPLCGVALAIAQARPQALRDALARCQAHCALSNLDVEEAILQGIPYSGFPGAVEALGLWHDLLEGKGTSVASTAPRSAPTRPAPNAEGNRTEGKKIFAEIYGELEGRVRAQLRRRHPVLEQWILEFAYTTVMGRGVLPLAVLEGLAVASLLGQRRRTPLHSHLRGALRNGWKLEQLSALLDELAPQCDEEMIRYARGLLVK